MPFEQASGLRGSQLNRRAAATTAAGGGQQARLRAALRGQSYAAGSQTVSPDTSDARFANDGSNAPGGGKMRKVYDANRARTNGLQEDDRYDGELSEFEAHWQRHQARYESVAAKTGLPAELIAALHWREASGDFGTYLHQGDPLGKPAVHVPKNIPLFHKWEDAAVHAIQMKRGIQSEMALTETSTDAAALATYSEYYNGLGYAMRSKPSPYVFAGTNAYKSGKFVRDGVYSAGTRDRQPGVMSMLGRISDVETTDTSGLPQPMPLLKVGSNGSSVSELQKLLGLPAGQQDGAFGPGTKQAVMAFQKRHDVTPDGVVGEGTWRLLRGQ